MPVVFSCLPVWDLAASTRFDAYRRLEYVQAIPRPRPRWASTDFASSMRLASDLTDVERTVIVAMAEAFVTESMRTDDRTAATAYLVERSKAYRDWRDSPLPALMDRLTRAITNARRTERRTPGIEATAASTQTRIETVKPAVVLETESEPEAPAPRAVIVPGRRELAYKDLVGYDEAQVTRLSLLLLKWKAATFPRGGHNGERDGASVLGVEKREYQDLLFGRRAGVAVVARLERVLGYGPGELWPQTPAGSEQIIGSHTWLSDAQRVTLVATARAFTELRRGPRTFTTRLRRRDV